MKKDSSISMVLLLSTIAVTIFLFFTWTDEMTRSPLFVFNLAYTILLELLFFGYLQFARFKDKEILGSTYSVLGSILFSYLLFGFAVLITFNFFLIDLFSSRLYFSVLAVGTLASVIMAGSTLRVNNAVVEENGKIESIRDARAGLLQELMYLEKTYEAVLAAEGLSESFESGYDSSLGKLRNKISFLPPRVLEEASFRTKIRASLDAVSQQMDDLQRGSTDAAEIRSRIMRIVDDTMIYMESLK